MADFAWEARSRTGELRKGVMEAALGFSLMISMLLQQECAFEAIEFWFVPPFSCGVHECQRFREHREPCRCFSLDVMGFGEEGEKIRSSQL